MSTGNRQKTAICIASASIFLSLFLLSDAMAQDKAKSAGNDAIMQLYTAA
jgi:hypothetical protein